MSVPALDVFVNSTEHLQFRGNTSEMTMRLSNFLPNTTLKYYLYPGSLTFPPCTNNIIVLVFSNPVAIGEAQVSRWSGILQSIQNFHGAKRTLTSACADARKL